MLAQFWVTFYHWTNVGWTSCFCFLFTFWRSRLCPLFWHFVRVGFESFQVVLSRKPNVKITIKNLFRTLSMLEETWTIWCWGSNAAQWLGAYYHWFRNFASWRFSTAPCSLFVNRVLALRDSNKIWKTIHHLQYQRHTATKRGLFRWGIASTI